MDDDELRARLRAADPAGGVPSAAAVPSRRVVERIIAERGPGTARGERWRAAVLGGVAAALVAAVAVVAVSVGGGGLDLAGEGATPAPPTPTPGVPGPVPTPDGVPPECLDTPPAPTASPTATVPAPPPDVPPSSSPDHRVYVVQPYDTLSSIAEAIFGDPTAFGALADANDLGGSTPLCVGQSLIIPEEPAPDEADDPPSGGDGDRTYVVQPGDTLSSIAEAVYGDPTAIAIIVTANEIDEGDPIEVGDVLVVPERPQPGGVLTPLPSVSPAPLPEDVRRAIETAAPVPWSARPDHPHTSVWTHPSRGSVRFTIVPPPQGRTAAEAVQDVIADGGGGVDLPDGGVAGLANPVATGRMLVDLPADRLLRIDPVDEASSLDYLVDVLAPWLADVRAALG